ncbi:ATP-binding protein [Mycobacterium parmense]|uniref:Anti-sigma regulatory factor n=1 Tax=Mycobacterium parmense TaxID=185642 RepID=A0A7I7YZ25_9MYCO|nr:ATP-binding protein [Mycobacterium parmense]MCV7349889.1 ATP-binding protein [Mycobacterium parmense]ORW59189.1 anti-sigma regulatory factor [Mycobacterium parmense]BBZ46582.1 anti-sigma regulatory factor [Mycobacterium parmense]
MIVHPPPVATPERLSCAGAADAATAAEWRRALHRWLKAETEASADIRDSIVLGVNEALANCVEHAYRAHPTVGTMRLQASHDPAARSVSVCVSDRGTWHRPGPTHPGDALASRGIRLMHALADHCTINARPTGTTVCLDYAIRPGIAPAGGFGLRLSA